jgi:nicotinate phosphoribosyltransferase
MREAIDSALLTDLYQLTMLQAYHDEGLDGTAVFELFVRGLPEERNFLLLAGIEQALDWLEQLRFDPAELDWLRASGRFRTDFIDALAALRFTGEVHAMREGTVFFANEPVLRVEAPIAQAQLVESRLLNLVHYATLVASKAARCRLAAPDSLLVDFGLRRAHGAEAGLLAARSSYLAGFAGSATVLAGQRLGCRCSAPWRIPTSRRTSSRSRPSGPTPMHCPGLKGRSRC